MEHSKEYLKWYFERENEYKKYQKQWYDNDKENRLERKRKYCMEGKGKKKAYDKQYHKYRRKTNLKFNLSRKMGSSIYSSLKKNKAGRHWEELVGYNLKDLIKRLKITMPKSYCWQDYMIGKLHLDHIIPISAFNFTKPEHLDFKRCWDLSNLRLLPARENIIKNAKLSKPFQPSLKI